MTVLDLLDAETRRSIAALPRSNVPRGTVLFRPGDEPGGFLLVTDGVIDVYLVGRSGREMLLYEVGSGQTCIQTTLCLLGRQPYSGEAVARTDEDAMRQAGIDRCLAKPIEPAALYEALAPTLAPRR